MKYCLNAPIEDSPDSTFAVRGSPRIWSYHAASAGLLLSRAGTIKQS